MSRARAHTHNNRRPVRPRPHSAAPGRRQGQRPATRRAKHAGCPHTSPLSPFPAGHRSTSTGEVPDPHTLSAVPTFTPSSSGDISSGLDVLAAAALAGPSTPAAAEDSTADLWSLHRAGPYNPSATLPPKVVKKLLALEFVEMSELRADIWPDEPSGSDSTHTPRRPSKPPVTSIRTWLECYGRMAAVLTARFPEKAAELWAYQTSIIHAAHTYEGANWVAYDRLYWREKLAAKDLNWSVPSQRLYSEAFTGRAKRQPQCPHCLSEDHAAAGCPHNLNPPNVGWFQGTPQPQFGTHQPGPSSTLPKVNPRQEICRNFNGGRCRFTRCRFLHACSECAGPHAAMHCPSRQATSSGLGASARSSTPVQSRLGRTHPYLPVAGRGQEQQ